MKIKYSNLFEAAFVVAIACLLGFAAWQMDGGSISFGYNGVTETRCIDGYKHTVGEGGQARQVLNENGGGVKC